MHDVIVLYAHPNNPEEFDSHYRSTHLPLVSKLPLVTDFAWGKPAESDSGYYLVARLSYHTREDAVTSLASPQGRASAEDLRNFAAAGVTILNVSHEDK